MMHAVTFYTEPGGTVVAVFRDRGALTHGGVGLRNGVYCATTVPERYLRERCVRVNEAEARERDGDLFEVLDEDAGTRE